MPGCNGFSPDCPMRRALGVAGHRCADRARFWARAAVCDGPWRVARRVIENLL